jgi:predicted ATP-grasp superfamily ATP-dependent carboligase
MLAALIADLTAIPGVQVATTVDERFPQPRRPGVDCVTLPPARTKRDRILDDLIASADAVWLIAPETDRSLEHLAARVERKRRLLLGPAAATIRVASDKARLSRLLARRRIPHPRTQVCQPGSRWMTIKRMGERLGYPVVVKPARGAGCEGVSVARDADELHGAIEAARRVNGRERLLLQEFVRGVAVSVSLLADGQRAMALTVNSQSMRASRTCSSNASPGSHSSVASRRDSSAASASSLVTGGVGRTLSYHGGSTPLTRARSSDAALTAVRACEAIPGLRGYIGVDLVLTRSEAVVIEINPRLTTAYLGVRSVVDENVAALAIAACEGRLPEPPAIRRSVRFMVNGQIVPV